MIRTAPLILRQWEARDRAPFAAMSADAEVMRFLGPVHDRATADAGVDRAIAHQAAHGFTFWALERIDDGAFLGFCGLKRFDVAATPITGDVEIAWRLRRDAWGFGYAAEAARAALAFGWRLPVARIVAMTVPANSRSQAVMARIGMTRRGDLDFGHPRLAADDPLRPHVVYVAGRP